MKKIFAILTIALCLFSCKNSVESEIIATFEDATSKMEQVNNVDEGKEVNNDLIEALHKIMREHKEEVKELCEKGSDDIQKAFKKYMDVRKEKCGEADMFMIIPSLDLKELEASPASESASDDSNDEEESNEISANSNEDWDELLDAYEEYADKTISYAQKIAEGDMSVISEYPELMEKAKEFGDKMKGAEGNMSSSQWARYMKITEKLTEAAAKAN